MTIFCFYCIVHHECSCGSNNRGKVLSFRVNSVNVVQWMNESWNWFSKHLKLLRPRTSQSWGTTVCTSFPYLTHTQFSSWCSLLTRWISESAALNKCTDGINTAKIKAVFKETPCSKPRVGLQMQKPQETKPNTRHLLYISAHWALHEPERHLTSVALRTKYWKS